MLVGKVISCHATIGHCMAASAAHSPSYVGSHILASALTSCSVNILVTMYKKRKIVQHEK